MQNISYQEVRFYKESNSTIYYGIIIEEDCESCIVNFQLEGTDATIVLFYDEWCIEKIY